MLGRVNKAVISGSIIDTAMRRTPLDAYERGRHFGASRSDLSLPVPEIMLNAGPPVRVKCRINGYVVFVGI